MTTTILKDHALNNIWAAPLQDLQHRVKPSRISPDIGFYNEAKVMWERIPLPDYNSGVQPKGWHVYPIGQLPMLKFGLEEMPRQKWIPATDVTGVYNVVVDLYADNGCVIPRNNYYLWLNYDNNLIMAVERNGAFLGTVKVTNTYQETFDVPYSLDDNGVTIRFYKNAITHTGVWLDSAPNPVHHLTDVVVKVTKPSEYANFLTRVAAVEASYGEKVLAFIIRMVLLFQSQLVIRQVTWVLSLVSSTMKQLKIFVSLTSWIFRDFNRSLIVTKRNT